MDGRTLARLLTAKETAPVLAGAPRWSWRRLQRTGARWINVIIDHAPPRGLGSCGAAALLLASVLYGVERGEHTPAIAAQIQDMCDEVASAVGFGITEVALSGEREVSREEILALAGITDHSSLLFLDARQARARLLTNPWIAEATVLKLYPNRVRIEVKERQAFALWQRDGKVALVALDGTVLEPAVPAGFTKLPLVVGEGAQHAAPEFLALLARYPSIAHEVKASVLVAERRWSLFLKDGVEVLLPEAEPARALQRLVDLDRSKQLLARDITAVDMRLGDRVVVRLSDAAAAARAEALKAAEKAAKKKKGSEA
jgi:cell division protein FtsQ